LGQNQVPADGVADRGQAEALGTPGNALTNGRRPADALAVLMLAGVTAALVRTWGAAPPAQLTCARNCRHALLSLVGLLTQRTPPATESPVGPPSPQE